MLQRATECEAVNTSLYWSQNEKYNLQIEWFLPIRIRYIQYDVEIDCSRMFSIWAVFRFRKRLQYVGLNKVPIYKICLLRVRFYVKLAEVIHIG